MIEDTYTDINDRFISMRNRQLRGRYLGQLRAVVVETNDPLQIYRIRFRCPQLHDSDLEAKDCPWAVPDTRIGGKRAGEWTHPCIGDWVWITFEDGHPYAPIWTGFANPTRRKLYPYPSIFGVTPLPVDEKGDPAEQPEDYEEDYLPKDSRPMSHGRQDRYGNLDMSSAVGFFPVEHKEPPPDPDHDPVQSLNAGLTSEEQEKTPFNQQTGKPKVNDPDLKYMLRMTKYGHLYFMGDQGYHWQKEGDEGSLGEFEGDFDEDEEFETKRWLDIQKLINEDDLGSDQRRILEMTRYGHYREMRDVGWKKSREGEYAEGRRDIVKPKEDSEGGESSSESDEKDERWIKTGTPGGWLFQMSDVGFDAEDDKWLKRTLLESVKARRKEDEEWEDDDFRVSRWLGRHGFKIAIDERGSDEKDSDTKENPHGRGILIKGRRSPGSECKEASGDERGFYWEFNEQDSANFTTWGTPLGSTIQMSDKHKYIMAATDQSDYPTAWKKFSDVEIHDDSLVDDGEHPQTNSHHMILDAANDYIRFKTKSESGEHQGLECRDSDQGDGPWVELVDADRRGLIFFGKDGVVALHGKPIGTRRGMTNFGQSLWMNDRTGEMVIYNENNEGRSQMICGGTTEVIGRDIQVAALNDVSVRASRRIVFDCNGTRLEIRPGIIWANAPILAPLFFPFFPTIPPAPIPEDILPPNQEPSDRGKRYNTEISCPDEGESSGG